jgi:hypothetical protein
VAENCTVAGDNPKVVAVPAGETATVTFTATCGTGIGSAQIQVVTTGDDIDPDGGKLAFVSARLILEELNAGGCKIFVMNADGTAVRQMTLRSELADVGRPTWSPPAAPAQWPN